MPVYKELNDIDIQIEEFDEVPLSLSEQKRWERRVKNKLFRKGRQEKKFKQNVMVASLLLVVFSVALTLSPVSSAYHTVISNLLEKTLQISGFSNKTNYKELVTAVNLTAVNRYGSITISEIMLDGDQLMIGTTYTQTEEWFGRPAIIQISMNGKLYPRLSVTAIGFASNEGNTMTYFVPLDEYPESEELEIEVAIALQNSEVTANEAWEFKFKMETVALRGQMKTIIYDQEIAFSEQDTIKINKIVLTPISTVVYYERSEESKVRLAVIDEDENRMKEISSSYSSNDESHFRIHPINLSEDNNYYLLVTNYDESQRIQIKP